MGNGETGLPCRVLDIGESWTSVWIDEGKKKEPEILPGQNQERQMGLRAITGAREREI